MYKINDGGIVRDATAEEIEMLENRSDEPELTADEALDIILGGEA